MSVPSYTYNRFKPTTVYGTFQNSDLSGGEVANATFDRNLLVKGNLTISNSTESTSNSTGALIVNGGNRKGFICWWKCYF